MAESTRVVKYSGSWTNYVHLGCSISADLSTDGESVISTATHGQLLIRGSADGDVRVRMNGHWNSVGWVEYSPDNSIAASACTDGTARLWDTRSGRQLFSLSHPRTVNCATFVADGTELITACEDGALRGWDVSSGEERWRLQVDTKQGVDVVTARDGRVACLTADALVMATSSGVAAVVPLVLSTSRRLAWRPGGTEIAVVASGAVVIMGTELDETPTLAAEYTCSTASPTAVAWSPDGRLFAACLESGEVEVVDRATLALNHRLEAHPAAIWDILWSQANGGTLMTTGFDGVVSTWDATSWERLSRIGPFSRGISAVDWPSNERVFVSASADGHFCLWDIDGRKAVVDTPAHDHWIRSIEWHADDERFLTASQDATIRVWTAEDGDWLTAPEGSQPISPGIGPIWDAAWMPDGRIVAVSEDGKACLVDPENPQRAETTVIEPNGWLRGVAVDPHGRYLTVASSEGYLYCKATDLSDLWNLSFPGSCLSVGISPDGELIGVSLSTGEVVILNRQGDLVETLAEHSSQAWSVTFSPDGDTLASAGADGKIFTYSVGQGFALKASFQSITSCLSARIGHSGRLLFGSSGAWVLDPTVASETPGTIAKTLTDSPSPILDDPTGGDLLGRTPLVEELGYFLDRSATLSKQISGERLPEGFVLHIGGRWGSGKTNLVNSLTTRVSPRKPDDDNLRHWTSERLSLWESAESGPIWWLLAMSYRRALLRQMNAPRRLLFSAREWSFRAGGLIRIFRYLALSFIAAFVVLVGTAWLSSRVISDMTASSNRPAATGALLDGSSLLANILTVGASSAALVAAARAGGRRIRQRWSWPQDSESALSSIDYPGPAELQRRYFSWLRAYTDTDVILVLDDLDRCSPKVVEKTLTALQLLTKLPEYDGDAAMCILVLADGWWLESAVESQMAAGGVKRDVVGKSIGAEYLEKVFISSLDLPLLHESQREALVQRSTGLTEKAGTSASDMKPSRRRGARVQRVKPDRRSNCASTTDADREPDVKIKRDHARIDKNSERKHMEIIRRLNSPEYRAAVEVRLIDEFAHHMDPTPRGVKRTLVAFWLTRSLLYSLPTQPDVADEMLMRWTILRLRWPSLVDELRVLDESAWRARVIDVLGREATECLDVAEGVPLNLVSRVLLP